MSYSSEMNSGEQIVRIVNKPEVCSFIKIVELIKWSVCSGISTRVNINGKWYDIKD